ncbi:uncharacterized protein CTRU02_214775 [Colletotrichum truncatum]|uniref:Uncharacterized protein n=1 Tax=Colletotrichum truncatum TaxID=5467 RepID=A0ACC3YFR0_COLTU|nr:uncharacterized protein CTRU02_09724 [Colletotrichum truncatum]KAF6788406.1 hypothetical protein CTRU02_09724 [Colletotrichum truncatum]
MFEKQSANRAENTYENSSMHYQDNDDDRELLLGGQGSKESLLFRWMSATSTDEHRKTKTRRIVLLGLAVVGYTVIVALIAGAFTSLVNAPSHSVGSVASHVADAVDEYPPLADCGHNSTTAQAAGCKFDLMMTGWSNPECLDSYVLEDSYNDASPLSPWGAGLSNWKWAADKEYKVELPSDPEELGHHDGIWTHFYFHKIHCAYVWRHLSHALARKLAGEKHVFVYKQALQYEHTVHCNWMVLEHEKDLMRPTWAEINSVNKCVELKLDLNGKPWTGLLAKEEEKAGASSPGY